MRFGISAFGQIDIWKYILKKTIIFGHHCWRCVCVCVFQWGISGGGWVLQQKDHLPPAGVWVGFGNPVGGDIHQYGRSLSAVT